MSIDYSLLNSLVDDLPQYMLDIKDFKIKEEIGEGGFGKVYRAIHVSTQKECAIKQM